MQGHWTHERNSNLQKLQQAGPASFAEKCLDPYLINWYIASLSNFFPNIKRVFIDQKDKDLFNAIDRCGGERIVAVVN